ncbi:glycosyltransferase family 2 protein [Aeromonas veronii]|uniref:glycosyltransferase family 2 protein n=1 Tax=Aeromonas veronii TaxID=654 RepID=UPI003BA30D0D
MSKVIKENPLVSILIPTFNREAYISETISSALAQTYQNIEVIVVDNASSDNTWEVCKHFSDLDPRVKTYRNEKNIGPVNNWRRCISCASGQYAKILWSDDLISNDYVEKTIRCFNDDVAFVFTSVVISDSFDKKDNIFYQYGETGLYPSIRYLHDAVITEKLPVSPGCALFRLSDLKYNLVNDIDSPSFNDFANHGAGPDILLFLLTALHYPYIGFVNEPLSFFREHDGSISLTMRKIDLYDRYQQAKLWFSYHYLPNEIQRQLSSITWGQRSLLTKKINRFSMIKSIYGDKINTPSMLEVVKFFLTKIYSKLFK